MKLLVFLVLACAALVFGKPLLPSIPEDVNKVTDELARDYFNTFVQVFQKQYASSEEHLNRFIIFKQNLIETIQLNQQHGSSVFGVTKFSDLTKDEFKQRYLNFNPVGRHSNQVVVEQPPLGQPADSVDWRTKGAVTAVKDQGQCGSCWAFSATEEVESMWNLAGNSLPELSPQQVVSCDQYDGGCGGGDTITAYKYIQEKGLETEKVYPYVSGSSGANGRCKYDASQVVAKISGYTYATDPCQDACNNQNETKLAANLASKGPVSICVYAETWQFYSGGVLKANCPHAYNQLDHCVQLVGYTDTYWLVRNSWNTDWGEQGYIYLIKGKNLCGVADEATFVTI